MLINALCDYYDLLAKAGKVLPEGFSYVDISYLIALTPEGKIAEIIDYRDREEVTDKKGKVKEILKPRTLIFPKRASKTSVSSEIIEHRPAYIFGLDYGASKKLETNMEKHNEFVKTNLDFLEGLDSPVVNAYRKFIQTWNPSEETGNVQIIGLGNEYDKRNYAFCLTGEVNKLLQDDDCVKRKWLDNLSQKEEKSHIAQCAILGKEKPIARIHTMLKGIPGSKPSGAGLINFKGESGKSYCNEDSYNSNISEIAMNKYTEALNYLLKDKRHKKIMDEVMVIYWAMDNSEKQEDIFTAFLYGDESGMDVAQTNDMLDELMMKAQGGIASFEKLQSLDCIDTNVDFYMVGIKPNSSRLAIKFIHKKKYAELLFNIAKFQEDLKIGNSGRKVYFNSIKEQLVSPNSKNDNVNPSLLAKIFESIIYGYKLPTSLLENVIRRIKTDSDEDNNQYIKLNDVRVGLIKACINRKNEKEELKMGLDLENRNQAYLCGRLFAVLEKLQRDASNNSINRTIKDAYFSSAASRPVLVFPKLVKLAQNHLDKMSEAGKVYYSKMIGEIMDALENGFPKNLNLEEQGKFIVGYYQQYQKFFEKKENNKVEE